MDKFLYDENEDIEDPKKKELEILSQMQNKYKEIINNLAKTNIISLLDHSYLINYLEQGGSVVNCEKFSHLINKSNDKELIKITKKLFPEIYSKIDNKIKSKISKLYDLIIEDKKHHINFTKDQLIAIKKIFNFLSDFNQRSYGLYGYAGTGKTTIIVEILSFLLKHKLIKSVAFTAPTNKAVTVIKSKFRNYLKDIYMINFPDRELPANFNFDEIIDKLYEIGVKIDFITIHKLLKFEKDVSLEGDFTFVKNNEGSLIYNYEIVIIDECSMVSIDIAEHIFNEIRFKIQKDSDNFKTTPKVIFLGDPAQLPPVGENLSVIFLKSKDKLSYNEYEKLLNVQSYNCQLDENMYKSIKSIESVELDDKNFFTDLKIKSNINKYELFINDIVSMNNMTLKKVMRSKKDEVTQICYQFRLWALGEVKTPELGKFIKDGVKAYRYEKGMCKTKTQWFEKCMEHYKKGENCNIILTWTNHQSDEYNREIRARLFKNKKMEKFMIGDILMLSEFYNMDDGEISYIGDQTADKKFYTSEQIKVVKIEQAMRIIPNLKNQLNKKAQKLQNSKLYESKYSECINTINSSTQRAFLCWKLSVVKIGDSNYEAETQNKKKDINIIYVIHDKDEKKYNNEKMFIKLEILKLIKYYNQKFKNKMSTIELNIIKPLWNEFNANMRDPFASVSYGYAITCHKGQGSNFYNAFVDIDDILKNIKDDESKKCLYTAVTRTSNELYLLS